MIDSLLSFTLHCFLEVGLLPSCLSGSAYLIGCHVELCSFCPPGGRVELCSFLPSLGGRYKVVVCFVRPVSGWSLGVFR